jgi:hypothetical protein
MEPSLTTAECQMVQGGTRAAPKAPTHCRRAGVEGCAQACAECDCKELSHQ